MRGRAFALALVLAGGVLLTACRVDVTVGVRVHGAGDGEVSARFVLDRDAAQRLGGPPATAVRVDDLRATGWTVDPPRTDRSGRVTIAGRKHFSTPAQLRAVVDELSGAGGPFREFRLRYRRGSLRSRYTLAGTVDLTGGVPGVDERLTEQVRASGLDPSRLGETLRRLYERSFHLTVVALLPGAARSNAPRTLGGHPVWSPAVGERAVLHASSAPLAIRRIVLATLALVLAAAAVVVLVAWRRAGRRRVAAARNL